MPKTPRRITDAMKARIGRLSRVMKEGRLALGGFNEKGQRKEMSIRDIVKKAKFAGGDISNSYWNQVETQREQNPTLGVLDAIARALDMNFGELLAIIEPPPYPETTDEHTVVRLMRQMTPEGRADVVAFIRLWSGRHSQNPSARTPGAENDGGRKRPPSHGSSIKALHVGAD